MDEKSTEAEAAETRATAEGDLVATVKALAGAEASSRKWSAGTSRGYLAFIAKDYRDDTYYWCVLVFSRTFLSSLARLSSGAAWSSWCFAALSR